MTSRRGFIKSSGALAVFGIGLGGLPSFVARAASGFKLAQPYKKNKILVCIFQRGAMDGLMAVSPFTDPYLKAARPTLFMSAAQSAGSASLIDLDGRFGLHPGFKAFEKLFREKKLAIVHGWDRLIIPVLISMRRIIWNQARHSTRTTIPVG